MQTDNELPEVVITDTNLWKKNLKYFKRVFLGEDKWGRNAVIKNEDVLFFNNEPYALEDIPGFRENVKTIKFKAWAKEPIIIDLPLLGYELYVDLIDFTVVDTNGYIDYNIHGYFYYKPYANVGQQELYKIERNRRQAYYNSSRHFLRSLFSNNLRENGYIVLRPDLKKGKYVPIDLTKNSVVEDDVMRILGQGGKLMEIAYYHKADGSPLKIEKYETFVLNYSISGIIFLKDTCSFNRDGVISDNNIQFIGRFSDKRVGACLPGDYIISGDRINRHLCVAEKFAIFAFVSPDYSVCSRRY